MKLKKKTKQKHKQDWVVEGEIEKKIKTQALF
jgi:hypothetical protein